MLFLTIARAGTEYFFSKTACALVASSLILALSAIKLLMALAKSVGVSAMRQSR